MTGGTVASGSSRPRRSCANASGWQSPGAATARKAWTAPHSRAHRGDHRKIPDARSGGFGITAIIGIVGALLGGYLGRAVGWYREDDPVGFLGAVPRGGGAAGAARLAKRSGSVSVAYLAKRKCERGADHRVKPPHVGCDTRPIWTRNSSSFWRLVGGA